MRTTRAGFEKRRGIKVAYAECLEIRHQRGRLIEAELRRELETVGGERDGGWHQPAPMLQNTDHGGSTAVSSPPQIERSGRQARGALESGSHKLATRLSVCTSGSRQSAVKIGP